MCIRYERAALGRAVQELDRFTCRTVDEKIDLIHRFEHTVQRSHMAIPGDLETFEVWKSPGHNLNQQANLGDNELQGSQPRGLTDC